MGAIPGVGGGGGPTAEEIMTQSVQAVGETQTRRSSVNATVVVTAGENVTETQRYAVRTDGVVNRDSRRAAQVITQRQGTGRNTQESTTVMYRIRGKRLNTTTQQGDRTVRLTITARFSDYGTDTEITLPDAAKASTS